MWFVFGIITLLGFSIYGAYKRINASWSGAWGDLNGTPFRYKLLTGQYGAVGLMVGVEGVDGYDYTFKKETIVDRFFKFIRLSDEHQTGHKEFDDLIYVVSDNSQLHDQLSANMAIRNAVIELFTLGEALHCEVREVRNNSGKLWVKYKGNSGCDKGKLRESSSKIAAVLKKLKDEIEYIPQTSISQWNDPFVVCAAVILAISTGLAINGFFHAVRISWGDMPFTVDSFKLFTESLYWGAGIIVMLIVAVLILLGRSARAHLVMIELLLVGSFGAVSTSFAELRDMNMELDNSVVSRYEAETLDKKIRDRRGSKTYYLYLNDWNKERRYRKVSVSSDFYESISIGDKIILGQRKGYLNYRWVESIKKKGRR